MSSSFLKGARRMKIFSISEDDPSHPFSDDVMTGDNPPIKYCKICTHFNRHVMYDSSTGNVKASDYGTCYLDQHVHTVGEKACPCFCYHASA